MKTQEKRNSLRIIRFLFYVTAIILIFVINCSNVSYAGERLTFSESIANVRSGPGTNYDTLW